MQCPICKKNVEPADGLFRPFCSERCKMIDLDNWLSGRYYIPAAARDEDDEAGTDEMKESGDGFE